MIELKYKMYKSSVGGRKLGASIDWNTDGWKFQTENDEILSELNALQDEGRVMALISQTSFRGERAIQELIETVIPSSDANFIDAVGKAVDRRLGGDEIQYSVIRQAIYEDGIKIGE